MAKRKSTKSKRELAQPPIYLMECYVFGYTLTVVGQTPGEARKALISEIKRGCEARAKDWGCQPNEVLDAGSATNYVDNYTSTVALPMTFGKVEWF